MRYQNPQLRDQLAAEYVLGTLTRPGALALPAAAQVRRRPAPQCQRMGNVAYAAR